MVGLKGFFKGKARGKKTISHLSTADKEEIIHLYSIEQMRPSAIAEELGHDSQVVSKVIEMERRKLTKLNQDLDPDNGSKDLKDIKLRIAKLKLEDQEARLLDRLDQQEARRNMRTMDQLGIEQDPGDDQDPDPFAQIAQGFLMGILKNQSNQPLNADQPGPTNPGNEPIQSPEILPKPIQFSDDEINRFLDENPAMIKKIQKFPDLKIAELIKQRIPIHLSDQTIRRAVELIKKKDLEQVTL